VQATDFSPKTSNSNDVLKQHTTNSVDAASANRYHFNNRWVRADVSYCWESRRPTNIPPPVR